MNVNVYSIWYCRICFIRKSIKISCFCPISVLRTMILVNCKLFYMCLSFLSTLGSKTSGSTMYLNVIIENETLDTNIKRLTFLPLHILLSFTLRKISPAAGCASCERNVVRKKVAIIRIKIYNKDMCAKGVIINVEKHKTMKHSVECNHYNECMGWFSKIKSC